MKEAERIIYVCSNHKLPSKNIMDMSLLDGENKEYEGTSPFFPKRVIPVDISPHSLRCELVIQLERLDMTKVPKAKRPPNKPSQMWYNTARGKSWNKRSGSLSARDKMYPPPLRGNLYPSNQRRFDPPPQRRMMRPMPYARGRPSVYDAPPARFRPPPPAVSYGPPPIPRRGEYQFDDGLNRYSDFRRDVEDAIDSSYPPPSRGRVSQRLAMANAMLERGLRLAEEAMAEEYRSPVPPTPSYMRRGAASGLPMREPALTASYWARNDAPAESWRTAWNGNDNYQMIPPRSGNMRVGGPSKPGRGNRGGKTRGRGGGWRR